MKKGGGYGVVYQEVTRNKNISAVGKGLYAYFSAFCGVSDECYPSVETITKEMGMTKDTFYRHVNALVAAGVVEKHQSVGEDGKFGRVVYRLTHEVTISEKSDLPCTENADTAKSDTEFSETKKNNLTINNTKNNMDYQRIADMYNSTCISFPKLTKLSEKRKKTIRARLAQGYTAEDFQKLFKMAEGSSFLKGGNSRNWSATFDWLIADGNMVKVLEGNYEEKGSHKSEPMREYYGLRAGETYL